MIINTRLLSNNAKLPTRGTEYSAGFDLYADIQEDNLTIYPGETVKIGTGIAMEIPQNHFGAVFARSGLSTKKGLRPANCVGVIDSDYRGEILVALHNDTTIKQTIKRNDRIAQLIIMEYPYVELSVVDSLQNTERGEDGYGSTGE